MHAQKINTLSLRLGDNVADESPDSKTGVEVPIVPTSTEASMTPSTVSFFFNGPLMIVGVEVQFDLLFFVLGPVDLEDVQ